MEQMQTADDEFESEEIVFEDPVAYLRCLGIEAELIAMVDQPLAPAAA